MTANCIVYDNVSKRYDPKQVLSGLSLAIPAGITTAIVGESGSGKSTLLQMANGLVRPDAGRILVFDEPVTAANIHALRLNMGYSVQGAGLFPHLTVFENATLMARLQRWSTDRIDARFAQLMGLLELDPELYARYPYSLSGGQQQRVSLCRALMLNPPLLLLDEPFSALDPLTRESIHEEFQRMRRAESRSIVLVTHDMQEAITLADEIIVLHEGRVEQQGSATAVQQSPASDYVADLLGVGEST